MSLNEAPTGNSNRVESVEDYMPLATQAVAETCRAGLPYEALDPHAETEEALIKKIANFMLVNGMAATVETAKALLSRFGTNNGHAPVLRAQQ